MNTFLFVTHVTPKNKRSTLRQSLFEIYNKALLNQSYPNWKLLQIGDHDFHDTRFLKISLDSNLDTQKQIENIFNRSDVTKFINDSDYLIKLDDDDIISPNILERLSNFKGDLFYDEYHSFYDVCSSKSSFQRRPWIASTAVHKTEHALSKINDSGPDNIYLNSLLYTDHSQIWHKYYSDKNIQSSNKNNPVYLRVLSPTSISSGCDAFPLVSNDQINYIKYHNYLRKFGTWNISFISDFTDYKNDLLKAWFDFNGPALVEFSLNNSIENNFIYKVKKYFFKP
ncbi:MAG: hypothetical protein ACK5AY_00350 [Bacteroidota bacterium]